MNTNINQLLEKYWNTETSLQEEAELRAYFSSDDVADEHKQYNALFEHFTSQRLERTNLDVEALLGNLNNMDDLIEKYLNVETTLEEEKIIRSYFNGNDVEAKHAQYLPLFDYYKETSELTSDLDLEVLFSGEGNLDQLIEKYWNAETTLEEEKTLAQYFAGSEVSKEHAEIAPVFAYYQTQRSATSNIDVESLLNAQIESEGHSVSDNTEAPQSKSAKVINLRQVAAAVAAMFVLGFAAVTVMNTTSSSDTQYRGKYVQLDEEAEAQEAYEITKQALALLSKKINKGSNTVVTSVAKADKASIFK